MKNLDVVVAVLLVIGGINWGLVGLSGVDAVAKIFGGTSAALARGIYIAVGLAALYQAVGFRRIQRRWGVARQEA